MTRIGKFLSVRECPYAFDVTGRREWTLVANDGTQLGVLDWHYPWSEHVLKAERGTVWSAGCLKDVAAFLDSQVLLAKKV